MQFSRRSPATTVGHRVGLGDVAGGGEYAGHFTALVAVHRRVVEHLGELAGDVADGERIVPHRAGLEDLRVARLRTRRVGEVAGEIGTDKPLAGDAGHLLRRTGFGPTHAELDAAVARLTEQLVSCAPDAQKAAKDLIAAIDGRPIDDAVSEETAQRIARRRTTDEAKDGIAAFLEKRPPAWLA